MPNARINFHEWQLQKASDLAAAIQEESESQIQSPQFLFGGAQEFALCLDQARICVGRGMSFGGELPELWHVLHRYMLRAAIGDFLHQANPVLTHLTL